MMSTAQSEGLVAYILSVLPSGRPLRVGDIFYFFVYIFFFLKGIYSMGTDGLDTLRGVSVVIRQHTLYKYRVTAH